MENSIWGQQFMAKCQNWWNYIYNHMNTVHSKWGMIPTGTNNRSSVLHVLWNFLNSRCSLCLMPPKNLHHLQHVQVQTSSFKRPTLERQVSYVLNQFLPFNVWITVNITACIEQICKMNINSRLKSSCWLFIHHTNHKTNLIQMYMHLGLRTKKNAHSVLRKTALILFFYHDANTGTSSQVKLF